MEKLLDKKIIITGGGSGGHISPALAIIEGLRKRYSNALDKILYIGSNRGMAGELTGASLEQKVLGETDIQFKAIRGGKLQRYLSWSSLTLLLGVVGGVIDSWRVISSYKPDLIISTGGFVTVPICFIGWLKKIPIYIHEQTAAVGLANKIVSRFAKRVYITFEQSHRYFPKSKSLHTGNAVREKIFDQTGVGEVSEALSKMVPDRGRYPILLMIGGGQGSHLFNITIRQMLRYLVEDFQLVLQTGDNQEHKDYDILIREKAKLPLQIQHRFFPTRYISADQIGYAFSSADLIISRAGANTVYELGVLKKPAILIPIPWVTHNEQYKNAKTLEELGLALILPEGEFSAERLFNEIKKFVIKIREKRLNIDSAGLENAFPTDAVEKILNDIDL